MEISKKTLVTVILVVLFLGAVAVKVGNSLFFKGQLDVSNQLNDSKLPDLKASLIIHAPEIENGDLIFDATIENLGPAEISGDQQSFKYSLYINDTEVFSNVDTYSSMAAGDAFNFKYPVSRQIYQYGNKGTAKFIVDSGKNIKEADESNNQTELSFSF